MCSGYSFFPHLVKGEGLFISVMKKKEESFSSFRMKTKSVNFSPLNKKFNHLLSWITNANYSLVKKDELVFALHNEWLPLIEFLSTHLRIVYSGTCIAELKGDKAIPNHELAMSSLLNKNSFASVEVDLTSSLHFLRKEDFKIEAIQKGFALITHLQHPLGFINFLGNRFNNYYPANWRIRMK